MAEFLEGPTLAVIATLRLDGTPLLSPVWYEFREGVFQVVVDQGDAKDKHLRRDPRLTLVVAEQAFPYRGIEVQGLAELSSEGGHEATSRMAHRYLTDKAAASYLAKAAGMPYRLVRLKPERVRAWDYLDFKLMA
jgi:PPOX class probable F420-dependent enzyme